MSPLIRIPLGIIVMFIGFYIVKKTLKFIEWFGTIDWAEKKFGPGGTITFYKLLGVLIVFLGIFIATNIISDILQSTANLLTNQ